jgi:hypothetical protein
VKRSPLRRLTRLGRGSKPLRSTPKTLPRAVADAAEQFKAVVCSEPCIGTTIRGHVCDGPLQAMHVVPKQTLRRRGLNHLRYDPANGVAGCLRIHTRHDNKLELIDRELLPQRALDFAAEHGLMDALDRHWPTTTRSAAA